VTVPQPRFGCSGWRWGAPRSPRRFQACLLRFLEDGRLIDEWRIAVAVSCFHHTVQRPSPDILCPPSKNSDVSGERLAQDRTNPARAIAQRDVGSNAF
jgi:hypothetical protein